VSGNDGPLRRRVSSTRPRRVNPARSTAKACRAKARVRWPGEIAKTDLARDHIGRLPVDGQRRGFAAALIRSTGIDVHSDNRRRLFDKHATTALELDHRREHCLDLLLDTVFGEQRAALKVRLDVRGHVGKCHAQRRRQPCIVHDDPNERRRQRLRKNNNNRIGTGSQQRGRLHRV
jgi:hypothetical protein